MAKVTRKYCPRCFEAFEDGREACPDHDLKLIALEGSGEDLEGQIIDDKYEIVDLLGKGGMGTVYRARHMIIGREVALKVLRRDYLEDHKGVERFVREARAASLLKSRYSAMLHDFGLAPEGFLYYTMELASGRLVSDIIDRDGAVGPERTMHIAADICHSLAEAHAHNIVHRDIKADNIMISQDPDGHEIGKVLDFGTAKLIDTLDRSSRVTDPGIVCGTPEYMSPEQAQAQAVDGRSDLYSLGVLMFELLTGRLPFVAKSSIAVLMKHVNDEPPLPRDLMPDEVVPEGLERLLMRLLAKDPGDRPKSAVVVLRELQKLLEAHVRAAGSDSDISEHESFALDQSVEEAYRVPRGNTLIEMMDSPTGHQAADPSVGSGRATMELSPGRLWHQGGDERRNTTEKDILVVDTVHTGHEKLSTLPGDILEGMDNAVNRVAPKRRLAPLLLSLIVGGLLGATILIALVFGGYFDRDPPRGKATSEGDPGPTESELSGTASGSDSEPREPDVVGAFEPEIPISGDSATRQLDVLRQVEQVDSVGEADLLDMANPADLLDMANPADLLDMAKPADPPDLHVQLDREPESRVDHVSVPDASVDLVSVPDASVDLARSSDLVVGHVPSVEAPVRRRDSPVRKKKRKRDRNKEPRRSGNGPVEFTLDDLQ